VFRGVGAEFQAGRYHSLVIASEDVPPDLEVAARTRDEDVIMAVRHRRYPVHGVQFHPESVLTGEGRLILKNFLDI
jgi:anthranilate synthase component 2